MLLVQGALDDVERDRETTQQLGRFVAETGDPAFRGWTPPRQVAFGRRDAAAEGYEQAREAARDMDFDPVERGVGGRAVAYSGETVAFVSAVPTDGERDGIQRRYREATDRLQRAFRDVGATVRSGEPDASFCPGDHSLRNGGKLAGVAQRVRREHALVGGCVVALEGDETDLSAILEPVYDALGVPFDPKSVGSVEGAGGPGDADAVVGAIERAFVGDRDAETVTASALAADAP